LYRFVTVVLKIRAQYFMTTHNLIEASLDDFWLKFTGEPKG